MVVFLSLFIVVVSTIIIDIKYIPNTSTITISSLLAIITSRSTTLSTLLAIPN